MTQILSVYRSVACLVRQLENHMYRCCGVYGLIVVLGGFKAHLICRRDCRFVQAMTHAPYHAIHVQLSVCPKHDFQ